MKKSIGFLTVLFVCLFCKIDIVNGQSNALNGNWYSTGTVSVQGVTNSYLGELKLQVKGIRVTGTFNYYFRDSLFTNKVTGIYQINSKYLTLNPIPIILHGSTSTKLGAECKMTGLFQLKVSKLNSVLSGYFLPDPNFKYTCPSILFDFERSDEESSLFASKKDTLDPVVVTTQRQFEKRAKDYFKQIDISTKNVDIELYDNGEIDNDSVSVFFNNKLMLKKTMLTHVPIRLSFPINDNLPFNEISMFANNVGTIAPNTATMIVMDGDQRYELELNSDFKKTATIKLINKKK
jgi:hypothetical protein